MIISPEEKIKKEARKLGFDFCGIAHAEELIQERKTLEKNIEKGYTADMAFLSRNPDQRANPTLLMEGAESVIVTLTGYHIKNPTQLKKYKLSRYAMFQDYHKLIKDRLQILKEQLCQMFPQANTHLFVDTSPLFEKAWAVRAGAGGIGKNTLLLHPKLGSFVFIGGIITDIKLNYNTASSGFEPCMNCSRCIDACPTGALKESYTLDASRCISYLTIESKKPIPKELAKDLEGNVFGCDICQDVCPWNKCAYSPPQSAGNKLEFLSDQILENLNEQTFQQYFEGLPVMRAGLEKIRQNILAVNG